MKSYFLESEYFVENLQRHLSMILLFCAVLLSASYIYFINSSVFNAVAREQDNKEIAKITAAIGAMENSYVARKGDINIDMAYSLGFKDDFSKVHFSSENTNVAGSISLLGNEI